MNEPIKTENTDIMSIYQKSENILSDIQNIIETSQRQAYYAVDTILSQRNWLIGYRIAEEELKGENRAEYGANVIKNLLRKLTKLYGKGFTKTNLYNFYSFYKCFPGPITAHYYRCQIPPRAAGMRKRHMSRPGVSAHYSRISIRNITIVSCSLSIKSWWNRKCQYVIYQLAILFACQNCLLLRCFRSTMPPHRFPQTPCIRPSWTSQKV